MPHKAGTWGLARAAGWKLEMCFKVRDIKDSRPCGIAAV